MAFCGGSLTAEPNKFCSMYAWLSGKCFVLPPSQENIISALAKSPSRRSRTAFNHKITVCLQNYTTDVYCDVRNLLMEVCKVTEKFKQKFSSMLCFSSKRRCLQFSTTSGCRKENRSIPWTKVSVLVGNLSCGAIVFSRGRGAVPASLENTDYC